MASKGISRRLRWLIVKPTVRSPVRNGGPPPHVPAVPSVPRPWTITGSFFVLPHGHGHHIPVAWRFQRTFASDSGSQDDFSAKSVLEDSKKSSFRQFMSSVATAPVVPMFLGVTGAIPFLILTPPFPYLFPLPELLAADPIEAQTYYGAVILSFLGGPHWGLAMVGIHGSPNDKFFNFTSNTLRYIWSVAPCLLAWPSLLMATVPRLQFLICSFGLALVVDIMFANRGLTPPWYLPLRLLLSGIVILCLTASVLEVVFAQKLEAKQAKDHKKSG